jgi:hypothetical protein
MLTPTAVILTTILVFVGTVGEVFLAASSFVAVGAPFGISGLFGWVVSHVEVQFFQACFGRDTVCNGWSRRFEWRMKTGKNRPGPLRAEVSSE